MMLYIFDTNILVEAKNRYYGLDFAPGFWDFVVRESQKVSLKSNDMVLMELQEYKDELSDWTKGKSDVFDISSDEEEIQKHFRRVADFVNKHPHYSEAEKSNFLAKADPWLIAAAIHMEAILVTHEKVVGDNSQKVKIPNVAKEFGIKTVNTFEMIRQLNGKFELGTA